MTTHPRTRFGAGGRRPSARYRKRRGQHFLRQPKLLADLADLAEISPGSTVLEIGAGEGLLTAEFAARAGRVYALEMDQRLVEIARRNLLLVPNAHLICCDILKFDLARLPAGTLAVGNLPYSIATPIIFRCLDHLDRFASLTFMVQLEVAQRLEAEPATKAYSSLSVAVQLRCHVEVALTLPRTWFTPPPKVDSALVRFKPLEKPPIPMSEQAPLLRLARAAFATRRKTLRNALRQASWIGLTNAELEGRMEQAGIDPGRRGETLSLDEFAKLARAMSASPAGG